jgi:UDP-N-acetylglucosamine/UDP-N-acetylgalactosamine diphosphorylase
MISFQGHDDVITRVYDRGQEHVFAFWNTLTDSQRLALVSDLADIDFDQLQRLYAHTEALPEKNYEPAPFIPLPANDRDRKAFAEAAAAGEQAIRSGAVAAFIVAGGQGSRLGFEGPKGMFPVAPVSGKTLFQLHGEKILASSKKYGVTIPWFVMTSRANHDDTVRYFADQKYFSLDRGDVYIFPQNMIPSLDTGGKLILETPCSVFKNPDGHGGSLTALKSSGALDEMKKRNISFISYFQVDNPLVRIIDPAFIGFHALRGADISSKALRKAYADEKVGVFVRYADNTLGITEYSDMPPDRIHAVNDRGELLYSSGNPAIHVFSRDFVDAITASDLSLPYHVARKKIASLTPSGSRDIDGYKFEKFVFDALSLTRNNVIVETSREEEFAPVKNASGADSLETCRKLMDGLHRRWLAERGHPLSGDVQIVEISPLFALGPDDIPPDLKLPRTGTVYLEKKAHE